MNYSRIITHVWPHLDEIAAIRLLKKHGEQKFPGISKAAVTYSSTGNEPEGKTWQKHLAEGTILIGTGGGPFDEHPTLEEKRKQGYSACLLVAKELSLDKNPIYKRLIEYVTEADQAGVHELHIANRLKTSYRLNPKNPEIGIALINNILDDWEKEQQLFVDARNQLQVMGNAGKFLSVQSPNSEPIKIAVVETSNYKMSAAARSLRIPIIIQRQPDGHVQILCDTDRNEIEIEHVVGKIRKAECALSGMNESDISKISEETWEKEGKITEVQNWFYQIPGKNMLNGTESTPDIPPTKIPLPLIVEIVQKKISVIKKTTGLAKQW